jgi:uncharacterized protein (TIGR02646 family)
MMPVKKQPEPPTFDANVRAKGQEFLKETPKPTSWQNKEYWCIALPDLRTAYGKLCAYCAQWIPHSTGGHTVEHFLPKNTHPHLAYEWDNFRYVSRRFNSRKGTQTIIDPFEVGEAWFTLNFKTFFVEPNPELPLPHRERVQDTIRILHLNSDTDLIDERIEFISAYCNDMISFTYLQNKAPFIAAELERQALRETIKEQLRSYFIDIY